MQNRVVPLMTHETKGDLCTVPGEMMGSKAMEAETPLPDLSDFIVGPEIYECGTAFGSMISVAHPASVRQVRLGLLRFVDGGDSGRRRVERRTRSLQDCCPFGDGVNQLLKAEVTALPLGFEVFLD